MRQSACEACKHLGTRKPALVMETIYCSDGRLSSVRLCYSHSVELFKTGQTKFIGKYRALEAEIELATRKVSSSHQNYFIFNSPR